MRNAVLRASVAAALLMPPAACGRIAPPATPATSANPSTAASGAGASRAPDLAPAPEQLTAALLTAGDLPDGYASTAAGAIPAGQLGAGVEQCGDAAPSNGAGPPGTPPSAATAASAQAAFQNLAAGLFLTESLSATADARSGVAGVGAAATRCPNFSGPGPGGATMRVALGQLSLTTLGDATAGVRVTATVDGVPLTIYAHVVAVAYRGVLIMLVRAQLDQPSVEETERLARIAFDKVRRTVRD